MDPENDTNKEYRSTALVCMGIAASLIFYVVIVEVLRFKHVVIGNYIQLPPASQMENIRIALFVFAALQIILMFVMRGALARQISSNDTLQTVAMKWRMISLISCAIAEIPAVCGLVLFLLAGARYEFYILWACSLALMVMFFPRRRQWQRWTDRPSSPDRA